MAKKSGLIIRLLKRHWLAIMAGCVTCLFLFFSLEPQPLRHEEIDLSGLGLVNVDVRDVAFSNDKRVGAIHFGAGAFQMDPQLTRTDKLFHLQFGTNKLTDTNLHHVENMAFDTNGELVVVSRERNKEKPDQSTHKLIRYQPATNTSKVVFSDVTSYTVRIPDGEMHGFSGILRIGLNGNVSALLSPDCQTMLKPRVVKDLATLNIISTTDPTRIVPLKLSPIDLKDPYTPYFEVVFSQNGKTVFLQHSEVKDLATRYRLQWFDVKTGEQIGTRLLPEYSRIVEPCVVGATQTFGRLMSSNPSPVIFSNNGNDEKKLVLDDIAEPENRNRAVFIDYESRFLAYVVTDDSQENTRLVVRRLPQGDICYQHVWNTSIQVPAGAGPAPMARPMALQRNMYSVKSMLPGSLVLVVGEETFPTSQVGQWIEQAREWLQLEPHYPAIKLTFIDADTRDIRGLLRLPSYGSVNIKHLPEIGILCITYTDQNGLHCLQYDNTLRKPWGYITLLALAATAGFALLLEFSCLLVWLMRKFLGLFRRSVVTKPAP